MIAVAMGNAEESVKNLAHIVTGSNYENGAAEVIEKLLGVENGRIL